MVDHSPDKHTLKPSQRNLPVSGKCPTKAWLLMFLAALPISFLAGIVAHFIGIAAAFIGHQLCRFLLAMMDNPGGIDGSFFSWIVMIVILLGFPFLAGALNHKLIAYIGKKADCHNPKTVAWAGLLNGIPLYLGHVLMSFLFVKDFAIMTFTSAQFEPVFPVLAEMVGNGGSLIIVFCVLEFIILMLGSGLGGFEQE